MPPTWRPRQKAIAPGHQAVSPRGLSPQRLAEIAVDRGVVIHDQDTRRAVGDVLIHGYIADILFELTSASGTVRPTTRAQIPIPHAPQGGTPARLQLLKAVFITNNRDQLTPHSLHIIRPTAFHTSFSTSNTGTGPLRKQVPCLPPIEQPQPKLLTLRPGCVWNMDTRHLEISSQRNAGTMRVAGGWLVGGSLLSVFGFLPRQAPEMAWGPPTGRFRLFGEQGDVWPTLRCGGRCATRSRSGGTGGSRLSAARACRKSSPA